VLQPDPTIKDFDFYQDERKTPSFMAGMKAQL